jgi:hypothetical protein
LDHAPTQVRILPPKKNLLTSPIAQQALLHALMLSTTSDGISRLIRAMERMSFKCGDSLPTATRARSPMRANADCLMSGSRSLAAEMAMSRRGEPATRASILAPKPSVRPLTWRCKQWVSFSGCPCQERGLPGSAFRSRAVEMAMTTRGDPATRAAILAPKTSVRPLTERCEQWDYFSGCPNQERGRPGSDSGSRAVKMAMSRRGEPATRASILAPKPSVRPLTRRCEASSGLSLAALFLVALGFDLIGISSTYTLKPNPKTISIS